MCIYTAMVCEVRVNKNHPKLKALTKFTQWNEKSIHDAFVPLFVLFNTRKCDKWKEIEWRWQHAETTPWLRNTRCQYSAELPAWAILNIIRFRFPLMICSWHIQYVSKYFSIFQTKNSGIFSPFPMVQHQAALFSIAFICLYCRQKIFHFFFLFGFCTVWHAYAAFILWHSECDTIFYQHPVNRTTQNSTTEIYTTIILWKAFTSLSRTLIGVFIFILFSVDLHCLQTHMNPTLKMIKYKLNGILTWRKVGKNRCAKNITRSHSSKANNQWKLFEFMCSFAMSFHFNESLFSFFFAIFKVFKGSTQVDIQISMTWFPKQFDLLTALFLRRGYRFLNNCYVIPYWMWGCQ